MILFVSDIHFDPHGDPDAERALARCLESVKPRLTGLILLGDVFDAFVEYPTLVPKGAVRLLGAIASIADAGTPVTFVVGNHDPWHRDYFTAELGVRLLVRSRMEVLLGHRVWFGHGDIEERGRMTLFRRFTRSKIMHRLYAGVLPGDTGQRLAGWVSRRFKTRSVDPHTVAALRKAAATRLATQEVDLVVLGHAHSPETVQFPGGTYVNTGAWLLTRTVAALDESGARLLAWNGADLVPWAG